MSLPSIQAEAQSTAAETRPNPWLPGRVVHVVPALFSRDGGIVGGAERYALELARHMAERVPTTLISFGDSEQKERIGRLDVDVIRASSYVRGQRSNPISLSLLSRLRNADIIHCHQQHVVASSLAAMFARLTGRRVVVTDHGGGGWDVSGYLSTDRWYHRHLHVSEFSRKSLGQTQNSRSSVILGGVDTVKFSPGDVVREKTVVFVGRLLPHKGVNDLVNALPPEIPAELIGPSNNQKFMDDLRAMSAGKQVRFRHDCGDEEVVQAYRRALCVVLPSVYRDLYGGETAIPELLGQTLLEGMACGAPAVCTNAGGMTEIVIDGVTGLVVPPNSPDALRQRLVWLSKNPEQARRLGRAARNHVLENFSWPTVVQRCLDAYAACQIDPRSR